ncbi:MAG: FAD-dependent oxidoreductase, partial [Gemmatimonadetes bacterium]|nr:FAD-dependent oxidoreductase [Gemmatimonadota bacterium]
TIDQPAQWNFWRDYIPELSPAWPGKLLAWPYSFPPTCEPIEMGFDPTELAGVSGFWTYRRILHAANFDAPASAAPLRSVCLVNWPQIDYWLGNLIDVSEEEATRHLEGSKQLSLSFLYWLQTEAPRPDGGSGWPGLRLRPDIVDTEDGLAKYPYIRESRRIRAEFTVVEEHVGTDARMAATGLDRDHVTAAPFHDSVGLGSYRIDLHPSSGGDNYIDVSSLPFQIPLGALIPQRVENLLPAAKNLGVTHITNGCYRLHPVEWGIGEAAGALAAHCLRTGESPRAVCNTENKLKDFQTSLTAQGVELEWPRLEPR